MPVALKPYPEYRDSGLPWLGEIPAHWEKRPLKRWVGINRRTLPETTARDYAFRYLDIGSVSTGYLLRQPERLRFEGAPSRARRVLAKGDTIISTVRTYLKAVYFIARDESDLIASTGFAVLTPGPDVQPEYLSYLIQSSTFVERVTASSVGTAYPAIAESTLGSLYLALPRSRDEQRTLAAFLAQADRRINRLIRAKRRLIELLNEEQQAIIHRAVTRGLDPSVRLKPSGIDWLGDVPGHWEVRRMKTIVSRVTSGSRGWSNLAADTGVLFIRIGNLTRASIDLDLANVVRLDLRGSVLGEAARTRVQANDILLSITAFIGSVAVVPKGIEEAYVSQHVACCRPRAGGANARWVAYLLLSSVGQTHGKLCMYGGTKQGLSLDDVKNYVVLLPPKDEQAVLVDWIETTSSSVDAAILRAKREICLLREYRTRLIADVVTGKLDVRGVRPALDVAEPLEDLDSGEEADDGDK